MSGYSRIFRTFGGFSCFTMNTFWRTSIFALWCFCPFKGEHGEQFVEKLPFVSRKRHSIIDTTPVRVHEIFDQKSKSKLDPRHRDKNDSCNNSISSSDRDMFKTTSRQYIDVFGGVYQVAGNFGGDGITEKTSVDEIASEKTLNCTSFSTKNTFLKEDKSV